MIELHTPEHVLGLAKEGNTRLARCCGPEPEMEYVMEAASWERRITGMRNKIEQGWNPPPLIAQYLPDGTLSLRDGNHRHEALRRSGAEAYWCVVWCDSSQALDGAKRLVEGLTGLPA